MTVPMIGRLLRDRYVVEELLASGGMADIYRGLDRVLDRPIAIKLLTGGDAAMRARFVEEARAMARLAHPNIIAIYDFGELDGLSYIVMEYIDGESLADLQIEQRPLARLQEIYGQVLAVLEFAHARNVLHRDLKPSNVLITKDGLVKVADFGLSRRISDVSSGRPGEIVGTIAYLPPEVFLGQPTDGRGDLYSVGVMMYESFTKRLPFISEHGDMVAVIYAHVHDIPVPPRAYERALPGGLERLILRLLEKEPEQRYRSAGEVGLELASFHFTAYTEPAAGDEERRDPHEATEVLEPKIRTLLDRMLSPQRSTKGALGKVLGAMLALRSQAFTEALALYHEALLEFAALKSEAEYLKAALGMGEGMAYWMRTHPHEVDPALRGATCEHLQQAAPMARSRGQTEEEDMIERLLTEIGHRP